MQLIKEKKTHFLKSDNYSSSPPFIHGDYASRTLKDARDGG